MVHVPIVGLAVLPLLTGMLMIFGALLEMIIVPVCALVFEAEREERRLMEHPPRNPSEKLFSLAVVASAPKHIELGLIQIARWAHWMIALAGIAPDCRASSLPPLNRMRVGIDRMP